MQLEFFEGPENAPTHGSIGNGIKANKFISAKGLDNNNWWRSEVSSWWNGSVDGSVLIMLNSDLTNSLPKTSSEKSKDGGDTDYGIRVSSQALNEMEQTQIVSTLLKARLILVGSILWGVDHIAEHCGSVVDVVVGLLDDMGKQTKPKNSDFDED